MERVSRVAPMASQIASGKAHKHARQSCKGGLALNRLKDFGNDHSIRGAPLRNALKPFYPISRTVAGLDDSVILRAYDLFQAVVG